MLFPVVGMGASAGGLAAFEAFFSSLPAERTLGMAFVVVQHLAPDHKSLLSDLIRRWTRMPVFNVENGMRLEPDCVYINVPNHDLVVEGASLRLKPPAQARNQRLPIDIFLRSLARELRERAIAIILSGTGSDGTLGVRDVKGVGGMVMAQLPETCAFDGMPLSAIATGLVDFQLAAQAMPAQLEAYAALAGLAPRSAQQRSAAGTGQGLAQVFQALRQRTGHDFSQYKFSTIQRRIERRMAVHQIRDIEGYSQFLRQYPKEVDTLFRELLIGVTSFFRDAEVFQTLEERVIPDLFQNRPAGSSVRVWVAGCSTGEEAYSIAILLQEYLESHKQGCQVQVFATDIDSRAIASARSGVFPANVASDITPERVARFFVADPANNSLRVRKSIRDLLIFSEQNILKDPPFSRMDLISCRNVLIYLGPELQKRIIPLFHYALKPGGILLLGTSEGIGDFNDLFNVLDRKSKLFQRRELFHGAQRTQLAPLLPSLAIPEMTRPRLPGPAPAPPRLPLRELTEHAILQQVAPAAALVNARGDVLYLHGRTGMFLEPAPGEPGVSNILRMAREGLRVQLSTALGQAAASTQEVHVTNLWIRNNGHSTHANLSVFPLLGDAGTSAETPLFLIVVEATSAPVAAADSGPATGAPDANASDGTILALRQELKAKEECLQRTIEELETSTEELKSSNEEMQSINEELQSTNEELETSKEELQSVNEELATVNAELQTKVTDLSRANNDMNNLLAGTGIGTIFVDHQLRILRFTPAATEVINLIPADIGRPVSHIVPKLLGQENLAAELTSVLDTLRAREQTVQTADGKWYTMRIQPYRTLDNVIEGAVMSFVEVTDIVNAREALRQANQQLLRLAVVVRDAHDAITVHDLQGRILAWNPAAERIYGWSESEALSLNVDQRIPPALQAIEHERMQRLVQGQNLEPCRTRRLVRSGDELTVWVTATALVNESGQVYAIATTERT